MQPLPLRILSLKDAAAQLDELGVQVANNGGSNAIAVAEHAIALLLSYYRRMPEAIEHAHSGGWSSGPPLPELPLRREINGKTIGIVGFGNVGRQVRVPQVSPLPWVSLALADCAPSERL